MQGTEPGLAEDRSAEAKLYPVYGGRVYTVYSAKQDDLRENLQ
jgi:hypothetical protein